ncbi:hypothetical protein IID21_03555 [Patescibacteria group bacterium]|nr:hypothetical protein [Patescibacteria group bacterium]
MFSDKLKVIVDSVTKFSFKKKSNLALLFISAIVFSEIVYLVFPKSEGNIASNILAGMGIGSPTGTEYVVELKEDGFYPKETTIVKGDTVKFITKTDRRFWPASSVHPDHTIYSEFDPRKPIEPSRSFSFKFDKEGEWDYHDHLASNYEGIISVLDEKGQRVRLDCLDSAIDESSKRKCWEKAIVTTLEDKGVELAFEVVAQLYEKEPDFAFECHGYVHLIGEEANGFFSQGKDMTISNKTSYCGYGFYHGFMETLLYTTGDFQEARDFCNYTEERTGLSSAWTACYHGIGHGAVDASDPRAWGNIEAIIEPGIELCKAVSETDFQLYLCVTGVFNSTEILSTNPKYGIEDLNKNPYELCQKQPDEFKEPCYTNMIPAVLRLTDDDFTKASDYLITNIKDPNQETIDNYKVSEMVTLSLYHEFIRLNLANDNYVAEGIKLCRAFSDELRLACIEGLSGGHMKYGEPEKEYVKGLNFCSSEIMREDEKEVCYKHILSRLNAWYSKEKAFEICESVGPEYKKFCN